MKHLPIFLCLCTLACRHLPTHSENSAPTETAQAKPEAACNLSEMENPITLTLVPEDPDCEACARNRSKLMKRAALNKIFIASEQSDEEILDGQTMDLHDEYSSTVNVLFFSLISFETLHKEKNKEAQAEADLEQLSLTISQSPSLAAQVGKATASVPPTPDSAMLERYFLQMADQGVPSEAKASAIREHKDLLLKHSAYVTAFTKHLLLAYVSALEEDSTLQPTPDFTHVKQFALAPLNETLQSNVHEKIIVAWRTARMGEAALRLVCQAKQHSQNAYVLFSLADTVGIYDYINKQLQKDATNNITFKLDTTVRKCPSYHDFVTEQDPDILVLEKFFAKLTN